MNKFLKLDIITRQDRNEAISSAREAITGAGDWIMDHHLFSNISATLNFELPLEAIEKFLTRLNAEGFQPDVQGELPAAGEGDCFGLLSLTFLHGEGDLKRDVPPFG
ncbi:hypothetical protein [Emcibacter sp.]|uniref:hypothetical protein n=1 Tax=Emcibacter sp. TaxID=1979954 RepID=UPI002AA7B97B|nr:hypothetical protein [Emcibacter sp.]